MIQDLINTYIRSPYSFDANIDLANYYEKIGQLASAVTHYLKAADIAGNDRKKIYTAISGAARNFMAAGGREGTVEGLLKRAIALDPGNPEPYFILAQFYEQKQRWHDCYMVASVGFDKCDTKDYRLFFEKAVSAWWIGNTDESREIIHCLDMHSDKFSLFYKNLIKYNILQVGNPNAYTRHSPLVAPALKRTFEGAENIQKSYAQSHQDLFALLVGKGKKNGFYLEIGSGDPELHSNTCLLEREFDWKGISIDLAFSPTQRFRAIRDNTCLQTDALNIDYSQLLSEQSAPKVIDYLQIDIDPPQSLSMDVLLKIPFEEYKFKAVTFEHNHYENQGIRERSREYLKSKNYKLVVSDISFYEDKSYEDWYVHASVPFSINNMDLSSEPKTGKEYFYDMEKFKKLYTKGFENWHDF